MEESETIVETAEPAELSSRAALAGKLSKLLAGGAQEGTRGAFLLVGVNGLTDINATFGYDIGDEVISVVCQRLATAVRDGDCLGRLSSSKFGVLLQCDDAERAHAVARGLMSPVETDGASTRSGALDVTVSIGAVLLPDHAQTTEEAFDRALQAIELARIDPNHRFHCFDPLSPRDARHKRSVVLADEIIRALNERRIAITLQPVVTSGTHDADFFECQLRVRLTDGSILDADEFVPAAEELGLSKLIDHRALELAIELLRAEPTRKLALKVSAQSTKDRHWIDALEALTGKDRDLPARLTVEITETIAVADMGTTARFVTALKIAGCRVALDESGAGYASFHSLRSLGLDMVKIDGSFIENLSSQDKDDAFVQTLLDLAHRFGTETVGEWAGNERSVDLLEKAGVSQMQGDFFGPPVLHDGEPTPSRRSVG
jgi:diguanylate cyclase (GGDEF)-like protein